MLYQNMVFLLEDLNFAYIPDVADYCCLSLEDPSFAFFSNVPKIRFFLKHQYIVFYFYIHEAIECEDLPS